MTISYGFYNSVDSDRKYSAVEFSKMFDGIIEDGVFSEIGNAFAVTPSTGLNVIVGTGRCWFDHTWTLNESPLTLALDAAHVTHPRIDTVILEINADDAVRINTIKILKGTAAAIPVPPTLTDTATLHQYAFSDIYIAVGATSISSGDITNRIDVDTPFAVIAGGVEPGGGDMLKSVYDQDLDNVVDVSAGLKETSGPTVLTVGSIADGEYAKRVGSTLVGGTPASGGGGYTWLRKTTTYTAVDNDGILADSSGGEFVITLPATPLSGTKVMFSDGDENGSWGSYAVTVARNGETIEGISANFRLNVSGGWAEFVFDGTTWQVRTSFSSTPATIQYPTYKNLVINGAMQVSQRGTSEASITTSKYGGAPDRFKIDVSALGTWTVSQEQDAPDGFATSYKLLCTVADAAPAAGDYLYLQSGLEGQNLQHIKKGTAGAESLTLSFWTKSNVTGTYAVTLYDYDNNRHVGGTFTVDVSATWEKKTLTFNPDTTGAFDNNNAQSLALRIWLDSGSSFTGGTQVGADWISYDATRTRTDATTNLGDTINNYFQVTGVQLEVGTVATDFEHLPYDVQLARCQWYCRAFTGVANFFVGVGLAQSTTSCYITIPCETMRTIPTLIATATDWILAGGTTLTLTDLSAIALAGSGSTEHNAHLKCDVASGLLTGYFYKLISDATASRLLILDAEL